MTDANAEQERRFNAIVEALRDELNVSHGGQANKRFGYRAIKVNGKIFAMVSPAGAFVVKLPWQRVEAFEAAHQGKKFEAGNGRPMKERLVVDPKSNEDWLPLACEALRFVRGGS